MPASTAPLSLTTVAPWQRSWPAPTRQRQLLSILHLTSCQLIQGKVILYGWGTLSCHGTSLTAAVATVKTTTATITQWDNVQRTQSLSIAYPLTSEFKQSYQFCHCLFVLCCAYCTGQSSSEVQIAAQRSFKVKTEAGSNDITGHPHVDKLRLYVCTVCDKQFTTKQHLNHHKISHTGGKLYSCTQCGKCFALPRYLRSHMYVHSTRSRYKCTECGRCFRDKHNLMIHQRIHSGEKPFECTVCSKRFNISHDLVVHSRSHSGEKPYKCHLCDKAFSQSKLLKYHMRVHTGEKPYNCSLCNKSFTAYSSLHRHTRHVHSNRRPYYCRYCGKLFKGSQELKKHVRIHTGAKPYSCRYCLDHFTSRGQFKAHLLKLHNEGTWFTCNICQKKFSYQSINQSINPSLFQTEVHSYTLKDI